MITPSYGLTATERVLPRLLLDWTTGLAQPGVDTTRAGVATFVGANGLIQSASANTQRLDWSTSTSGLLAEESRTNSILQSQNLATTWIKANCTILSDEDISPDGDQNADKIIPNSGAAVGTGQVYQEFSATAGVPYTVSTYLKPAGQTLCALVVNARSAVPSGITFMFISLNLATGTITTTSNGTFTNVSSTIQLAANGYYRVTLTGTPPVNTIALRFNVTSGVVGDGVTGVFGWGFQGEAGAFVTSYIPTEATAVTRNADVATMTGTNFSDWFNASEGTFVVQAQIPNTGGLNRRVISVNDATVGNSIQLALAGAGSAGYFEVRDNVNVQVAAKNGTVAVGSPFKIALAYKLDNYAFSFNGAVAGTNTLALVPTVTQMQIGLHATTYANGVIRKILYYPQRLINAETQAFSK